MDSDFKKIRCLSYPERDSEDPAEKADKLEELKIEEKKNFEKYQKIETGNLKIVVKDSIVHGIFLQVSNSDNKEVYLNEYLQNNYDPEVSKMTSLCWSGETEEYPEEPGFKCRIFVVGKIHKNR